jgi:hypothetical protein
MKTFEQFSDVDPRVDSISLITNLPQTRDESSRCEVEVVGVEIGFCVTSS